MKKFALVLACLAPAACAAPSDVDPIGASEDALRALSSAEIVGSLAYGHTSAAVDYVDGPTYRAFTFVGAAGDKIQIDVRAADADAKAWLLAPTFLTLRSNDDASAATRDSQIEYTLSAAGTYYIAFREKNFEDASFTVSLKKLDAAPPPPPLPRPPPREIPADISWCSGPTITHAQLLARYEPATTTALLSNIVLDARQRECQDQTGCRAWEVSSSVPFYRIDWTSGPGYSFSSPTPVAVPANGAARLSVSKPEIDLTLDSVAGFHTNLTLPNGSAAGFQTDIGGAPVQVGSWSSNTGSYLWFWNRAVTNTCLYASSTGRVYHSPGPGTYTEYEAVVYARYQPR